jgi:hypothetical protein
MKAETVTFLLDEFYKNLRLKDIWAHRTNYDPSFKGQVLTLRQVLKDSKIIWDIKIDNFYGWKPEFDPLPLIQALADLNLPNRTTIHLLGTTMKTELTYSVSHRFNLTTYRLKVSPLNTYETLIQLKEHFE